MDKLFKQLEQQIDGDVLFDTVSRMLYANDASPFQDLPLAIIRPQHLPDCISIVKFAIQHKLPLIPRASGTSLAGQCVGKGLVVDVSRYMNRIVHIDVQNRRAIVEPGVVCNDLNHELRSLGLMFAPDPSTSNYCTIGGMMGNNAWGIHSQRYGTTRDNLVQTEVVLSDGSTANFGPVKAEYFDTKLQLKNLEGDIYRTIVDIINSHKKQIRQNFPSPDGMIRNAGYPLDYLTKCQPWQANGALFNLAPFLCGSEGTLALTHTIELKLVDLPQKRLLLCAHFHHIDEALKSVAKILPYQPAALEIIDNHILKRTEGSLRQKANRFWIQGNPATVLLIEFHGDSIAVAKTPEDAVITLRNLLSAYAISVVESSKIENVWALRKSGLGLLMGAKGPVKGVTGIEDTAVNVADLPAFVQTVQKILALHVTDCIIYGPAGRGTLHLRPELNLNLATERQKYSKILDQVTDVVISFNGSISAKHGDGRLRAYYLERLLGSDIIKLLQRVKHLFDPAGIFNPNKILDAPPPNQDLRFTGNQRDYELETFFDWSSDSGLKTAIQKCNGAGVCLRRSGSGTMCPSYRATCEERHGTRGRANVFRQILEQSGSIATIGDHSIKQVIDLCLACKGCKTECPANVDMAQMKAEFLQHYHEKHGVPLRSKLINHYDVISRLASFLPGFSNTMLGQPWLKNLLTFHPERQLPKMTSLRFSQWWKKHQPTSSMNSKLEVVLVLDVFSEYYEPQIAISAISVLESLDFRVTVTPCLSLGRAQISQGLLGHAQQRLIKAINILYPYAEKGIALIGLEASEILTLRDEALVLFKDKSLRKKLEIVANQAYLFDEFIVKNQHLLDGNKFSSKQQYESLLVHGHCHQKSLVGMEPTINLLSLIPNIKIEMIPSGCCGMAGAFGYENEHYKISMQIAELELFPAIRIAPSHSLVVASGASCRHQISDGLDVHAFHPVEIIDKSMNYNDGMETNQYNESD